MTGFIIEVNDDSAQDLIDIAVDSLSEEAVFAWMNRDVNRYLNQRALNRFLMSGDEVSGPWEELSPNTKSRTGKPLLNTGKFFEYVRGVDAEVTFESGDLVLNWPDDIPSDEHNMWAFLNSAFGAGGNPVRPVFVVGESDEAWIINSFYENTIGRWSSGA